MALPTSIRTWINAEWLVAAADGAQTNKELIPGIGNCEIVATKLDALADGDNSVSVATRVGWGTAAAPTALPTAALGGVEGIVLSHPDIAAGSGVHETNEVELFRVPAGRPLLLTCDAPTGGNLTIGCRFMYVPVGIGNL